MGGCVTLATQGALRRAFDIRSAFLLTFGIWVLTPLAGALPLMLGAPHLQFTEAYFEAVSGMTTTGATVIYGLDALPAGMNLWRGLLNAAGGLGIAFVAMIFLPVMRVGGMQFFRTEGFDTFGKVLPRASDIAKGTAPVFEAGIEAILARAGQGAGPGFEENPPLALTDTILDGTPRLGLTHTARKGDTLVLFLHGAGTFRCWSGPAMWGVQES